MYGSTSVGVNMHGRKAVQAKSLNYHQATHLSSVLGVYRGPPPHTTNHVEETPCHCKIVFDSTSVGVNIESRGIGGQPPCLCGAELKFVAGLYEARQGCKVAE